MPVRVVVLFETLAVCKDILVFNGPGQNLNRSRRK
jgi:hypothetical protein